MLYLSDPLTQIPGIGPSYIKKLKQIGIETVLDLLYYFPFRFDSFQQAGSSLYDQIDQKVILTCELVAIENIYTRNGKKLTKGLFKGDFGLINVTWFNQPYLTKSLKIDLTYKLSGKLTEYNHVPSLMSPTWERVESIVEETSTEETKTVQVVPIYSEALGITSKWIREKVNYVLKYLSEEPFDCIPSWILERNLLYPLDQSIRAMHLPTSMVDADNAKLRFAYEELFVSQLRSFIQRKQWQKQNVDFKMDSKKFNKEISMLIESLPFRLTLAQFRCVDELLGDISNNTPMNRLLEGDVGSGKTVVAAIAMYAVYLNGYKSILMAPTQILASQHFETIKKILGAIGVTVELIAGGTKSTKKDADIYIGTHALLYTKVSLENVALTIIDEQHRFGVMQRAQLRSKHGLTHMLAMTATPIPRTLALTLYGDLDLSVIDEMPQGRKQIKTWVVPSEKRVGSYGWIENFIKETGEQVFIVCPFIELSESDNTVKAASEEYLKLQNEIFPNLKVGMLHGGMKSVQKDKVLLDFRNKLYDILVCTPVVEVGIDIPNASIMVIESAERFGLAQLHQFRGRVGRSGQQAYCLLFATGEQHSESRRLKALETTFSGIKLAEIDMEIRGVGNIFGVEQHGKALFKYADFFNLNLVQKAKNDAQELMSMDPDLSENLVLKSRILIESAKIDAN
ncbi:MAG: ATP-dependent DNA helicase RecG [bacterium]|nr:ATP-dependent DNA helicase RecG [bacterium]